MACTDEGDERMRQRDVRVRRHARNISISGVWPIAVKTAVVRTMRSIIRSHSPPRSIHDHYRNTRAALSYTSSCSPSSPIAHGFCAHQCTTSATHSRGFKVATRRSDRAGTASVKFRLTGFASGRPHDAMLTTKLSTILVIFPRHSCLTPTEA